MDRDPPALSRLDAVRSHVSGGEFRYLQRTFDHSDVAAMLDALHADGFALVPGVLTPAECSDLRDAIDRLSGFAWDRHLTGPTDHYKCVFNRDRVFLDLLDREPVVSLAEAAMGSDCHAIGQSAWRSRKGHDGANPHTDRVFFDSAAGEGAPEELLVAGRVKLPVMLCTAHFYLSDVDSEAQAPTYVIPGSHKSGRSLVPGRDYRVRERFEKPITWRGRGLEPVLVKAGDVLFFRSELWHSGGINTSEGVRYLLQNHYGRRVVAQQFSPYMRWQFAPHVVEHANPRQRRLLGDHKQGAYD
ncbi:hypothetical protein DFJ74DRAFT_665709 [Hyaloraphidium curvatum]|nr:hypothetical protein DFJ74DRAFT_665709 [Hyaloraphidium curvatum]